MQRGEDRAGPALSSKAGKKVCRCPAVRALRVPRPHPWTGPQVGPLPAGKAGRGRARLCRPGQGRGSRRRECGAAPTVHPQGPRVDAGAASSGPAPPPSLSPYPSPPLLAWGAGRCALCLSARPPTGPRTRARRGRCGCLLGGRPASLGLLGLPFVGPFQGQSAFLGGFRLLPGESGPGVHRNWRRHG